MAIVENIVGSILASSFQVLFDKLASLGLDYAQRKEAPSFSIINTGLRIKWEKMLHTINAVLDDAEDKQLSGKGPVKLWLDDVRDLAYDMEDLLDELTIQTAEVKSASKSSTSRGWMNCKFSCFGRDISSRSNPNQYSLVLETEAQEINSRLEEIVTRKESLRLTENAMDRYENTNKRLPSTSLEEAQFFGRGKEEAEIVKLLTGEAENGDTRLSVVAIVGMGGVGKTALAQRLYNDTRVKNYFERRAWVCVSDVFDVLDITKTILQSVTGMSCKDEDLNGLQVKLKDSLLEKKFLVVLDDVWNDEYAKWTALLKPLEAGAKGSKILITTRNHTVASRTSALQYPLHELPLANCTSLLAFHALGATNFEGHPYLKPKGEKIAEKCKGLPLAAKMLGGVLRNESSPDKWEAILVNRIWDLPKRKENEILPVLKLSYVHLPSYLKRCFAYCAVFPKDYEIERDELVFLWIAEGFLDVLNANEDILTLGRDHFDELVSRSFFQQSRTDASKFLMHDLLNDLAKSIADKTCFSLGESLMKGNEDDASLEKARYASFFSSNFVTSKRLRAYGRMNALRSLMLLHVRSSWDHEFHISNKVLHDLLTNLKYLRVFTLCHCSIIEVPNCVGDLKHLRHLNFSYTNIERLPESIVALCKLQALILRGCYRLSTLPPGITKVVSLQFLDIRDTESLKEMPSGMSNLKNLTILSKFVVGPKKGSRLKELQNLSCLQGELLISELQKVEEVRDAVDANLIGKQGLRNLFLNWDGNFGNLRNGKHEAQVLHSLRPHSNLEKLTILNYGGVKIPPWLDGKSYSKIVSLCLRDCPNVTSLPSLGQLPSLKEISLEGLHTVRMIGSEFYGGKKPFSSLTTLEFEEMLAWKDWSHYEESREEEVSFSNLQQLVVRRCPSLVGRLPCQLDRLAKLEIHACPHLNNSTSMIRLPSLRELYLEDCDSEILKSLVNLNSLTILKMESLAEFVCFDHGFMSCLVNLKELYIRSCKKLVYLWQDGNETQSLLCLQIIVIESCPQFTSFVAGEGEIQLPLNLERMELRYCESLGRLPSKMHTLRHLEIQCCPNIMQLTIFPNGPNSNNTISQPERLSITRRDSWTSFPFVKGRLAALKSLIISGSKGEELLENFMVEPLEEMQIIKCEDLRSLPQCLHTLPYLTKLVIRKCPELELEDFPSLPVTLSSFSLGNCPKIKSLPKSFASCSNLTELKIENCLALEIEEFPPLPITLSLLFLWNCPKIKCLPNQWHHLTSLLDIFIIDCPNIKCFSKGGLPPNLRFLGIHGCENMKQPVREWGLPLLTSLQHLSIDGISMGGEGEKVCFPSKEGEEDAWSLLFPSSLTILVIYNMKEGGKTIKRSSQPSLLSSIVTYF